MPELPVINQYYLLIFLFVVSFSAFLLSLGYSLYYYLHKQHQEKKPTYDPRDVAVHEAVKIVEVARAKALDMLSEAHAEAKTILRDSENIHSSVKDTFESKMQDIGSKQLQAFDQMSRDLLDAFRAVMSQEKESSIKSLTDVSTIFKSELTTDVRDFKDRIKQITQDTENHIRTDINNQYNELSAQAKNLNDSLRGLTTEAEQTIRSNLSGQTEIVKNEIQSFTGKLRQLSLDTENKLTSELGEESTAAKEIIHKLSQDLTRIIDETEKELKTGIKAEYDQVRKDLEFYKKDRYEKIDKIVRGMLEEVARDVLGKTMDAKDHEELIIKSLESIKKTINLKEL